MQNSIYSYQFGQVEAAVILMSLTFAFCLN